MDINKEIFKRYAPSNKLRIIDAASEADLLNIKLSTLERIIKEVGEGERGKQRSHNKQLYVRDREGNKWNSSVEMISIYSKDIFIRFYVQYNSTDTSVADRLSNFLKRGEYLGTVSYTDRYDNPQTSYFRYYPEDKARVIKAILKTYVQAKYRDKLEE